MQSGTKAWYVKVWSCFPPSRRGHTAHVIGRYVVVAETRADAAAVCDAVNQTAGHAKTISPKRTAYRLAKLGFGPSETWPI
jgi:hypothetical protein